MDEETDSEIIVDDGDGLDEDIDITIEPDVWDNVPETEAEPDSTEWDLGELSLDDDDDMIENDSNEDDVDLNDESEVDSDIDDDDEESAPEEVPDEPEDDEESAPE